MNPQQNNQPTPPPPPVVPQGTQPDLSKLSPENVDAYLRSLDSPPAKSPSPGKRLMVMAFILVIFMVITAAVVLGFSSSAGK